jgi:hypothetical protein
MIKQRSYLLDSRAAAKLRRQLTTSPLSTEAIPRSKSTILCMAKIEAHEGGGVYQAVEVFWNGASWVSITGTSRTFGVAYGTTGVRHIAADTSVAPNTIVRAFSFGNSDTTGVAAWFFQEGGGGGAYDGPFACAVNTSTHLVEVGGSRAVASPDSIICHPNVLNYTAMQTVAIPAAGNVYIAITREGTVSATVPTYGATVPANTATIIYIPLCSVAFSGVPTSTRQLQYGNIIIDKTVFDYCP